MNIKTKSLVKTFHILFACLWVGASASIVLLQCMRGWSPDHTELVVINRGFAYLDFILIIPGATGNLLTGFIMCKTTSWGFFRYRWVIVKWAITLSSILIGAVLLGPWQLQLVKLSLQLGNIPSTDHTYFQIRSLFTFVGLLQVLLLIFILAISVLKPWGKQLSKKPKSNLVESRAAKLA